jgi:hypothetical protein
LTGLPGHSGTLTALDDSLPGLWHVNGVRQRIEAKFVTVVQWHQLYFHHLLQVKNY